MDTMVVGLVGLAVLGLLYLLPTMLAVYKNKRSTGGILVLNLLLGWTGLGWVIALIWAIVPDVDYIVVQRPR